MKPLLKKSFVATALLLVATFGLFAQPVHAQQPGQGVTICSFIGPICEAIGLTQNGVPVTGTNATNAAQNFVRARAQLILSLVFIGIILLSVVIIVQAGIKYIQSQGNEGQIKEAQKAIKSVFIGIGVLFVGIIGIVLVLLFFNGQGFLNPVGNDQTSCFFDENGFLQCPDPNGNLQGSPQRN